MSLQTGLANRAAENKKVVELTYKMEELSDRAVIIFRRSFGEIITTDWYEQGMRRHPLMIWFAIDVLVIYSLSLHWKFVSIFIPTIWCKCKCVGSLLTRKWKLFWYENQKWPCIQYVHITLVPHCHILTWLISFAYRHPNRGIFNNNK